MTICLIYKPKRSICLLEDMQTNIDREKDQLSIFKVFVLILAVITNICVRTNLNIYYAIVISNNTNATIVSDMSVLHSCRHIKECNFINVNKYSITPAPGQSAKAYNKKKKTLSGCLC